jgi:hypothetical protein
METLRTDLRQAVPVIHDLLWEVSYPRSRLGSSGYTQFIDDFAIRPNEGASEHYMGDAWPGKFERLQPSPFPRGLAEAARSGRLSVKPLRQIDVTTGLVTTVVDAKSKK